MQLLKDLILAKGEILKGGILKTDSFVNHQFDVFQMLTFGEEFAKRFEGIHVDRILTPEVSGIQIAFGAAVAMNVNKVVYARKKRPITMSGRIFLETAVSPTKGGEVVLMVSGDYLREGDDVAIIDDFLASAETVLALARIVQEAGACVVCIGVLIEKDFEGGRQNIKNNIGYNIPIESLANIASMENGKIVFVD